MKLARLFSIMLIAVFAVAAIVASSASAIPLFTLPITKRGFTSSSGLAKLRVPSLKIEIDCATSTGAGVIVDDDAVSFKLHFLTCNAFTNGKGPCTIKNPGGAAGLIQTNLLTGLLGLLHEPAGHAGILFEPGPGTTGIFTTFAKIEKSTECEEHPESTVEGNVAGEFEPTGKKSTTGKITLAPTSATGKQKVTLILTLAGIIKPKLLSFGAVESTQEINSTITFEEAVEVM